MSSGRSPFRYVPWLARDVATGPGALFLVVIAVVCGVLWRVSKGEQNVLPVTADLIQGSMMNTVVLVAVLIAVGGMVSGDAHNGYYRAFFSKPMPVWWYYLQRWILGGIAVLLIPVVFGLGLKVVLGGGLGITTALMANVALAFLLVGGAVLLLSVFTRRDWLIVFVVSAAQRTFASFIEMGLPVHPAVKATWQALPPFHLLNPGSPMLAGKPLLHVVGYGLAMTVIALVVLRVRPLGSGGRA
jgi:hypothetical protein